MKHLAAYLLLGLAGNTSPSSSDIKGVLESVGIDGEDDRIDKLLSELKGKDINTVCKNERVTWYRKSNLLLKLIQEGNSKLASVPSGGSGGGGGGATAGGAAPAAGGAAAAEEEKPAEKEEEKEESDEDMGFGLFD